MDIVLTQPWQLFLVFIFLAGEAWLTWRNPMKGAAAVVFLLPAYIFRVRFSAISTNVLELPLFIFVGVALLGYVLHRQRFQWPERKIFAPLMLIALGATISTLRGIWLVHGGAEMTHVILGSLKGFILEPVLFTLLLFSFPTNYGGRTTIVKAYVASAVSVATLSVIGGLLSFGALPYPDNLSSFLTYDGRLRGFYLSPNHLAMYILPACVLVAAYSIWHIANNRRKFSATRYSLFTLSSSALLGALLWTKSAGAITGLAAGLIAYSLWYRAHRNTSWLYAIRYTLYAVILVGLLFPFLAVHFSSYVVHPGDTSSLASRITIWRAAEDMLKENWLFGIGPGAFQYHYLAMQKKYPTYLEWAVPQPHNLFLATWLQAGILGLLGFLWLIANSVRSANSKWRIANSDKKMLGYMPYATCHMQIAISAALIAIIVFGFVDTPFFKNDLSILFLLFVFGAFIGSRQPVQAR